MTSPNYNYSSDIRFHKDNNVDSDHSESISSPVGHPNNASTNNESKTRNELIYLLNSQKPIINQSLPQKIPLANQNITEEDVAFLEAANEVVKMNAQNIDPTIRDILNRLQYSNSPHGGMPFSFDYLKSIGASNDDTDANKLRESMELLSTSDNYYNSRHSSIVHNVNDYNHPQNEVQNITVNPESPTSFFIPPFTENPLRNPPNNLDFPQFSLDIFKNDDQPYPTTENINNGTVQLQNQLGQNIISHVQSQSDIHSDHTKLSGLLNYSHIYGSNTETNQEHYIDNEEHDDVESGENESDKQDNNYFQEEEHINDNNNNNNNNIHDNHHKNHTRKSITSESDVDTTRNYRCSDCGLSFKRSSDLKRHEKIHLKVPPNICPLCHKGFARKDALKRHINTLTCNRNRQRLLKRIEEEKNGVVSEDS